MSVLSAVANPAIRWKVDRAFFLFMGLAILGENVLGWTLTFLKTNQGQELHSTWVKVHALAFAGWLVLFVIQASLITVQRPDIHRRVGLFGIALATLMTGLTIGSGIVSFLGNPERTVTQHIMMDVSVHDMMFLFVGFVVAGILLRRKPEYHKRLMLLATMAVGLRWPPFVVRFLWHASVPHYYEQIAYVLIAILFDCLVRKKINPVFIWGLLIYSIVPAGSDFLFQTLVPYWTVRPDF